MQPKHTLLAAILLIIAARILVADSPAEVYLQVAGQQITGPPAPYVENNLLWGPVDAVARALGAGVNWQPEQERLTATAPNGQQLQWGVGDAHFWQDGQEVSLPAQTSVAGGVLVAPLPPIIEALGGELSASSDLTRFYVTVPMSQPVIRGDDEGFAIELETIGLVIGEVKYLDDPCRAYLNIHGARPHSPIGRRYIGQCGVWRLRWGQFSDRPPIARYVLDLEEKQQVTWLPRADGRGGSLIVGKFEGDEPELPIRYPQLERIRIYQTNNQATVVQADLSLPAELDYRVLTQPWRIRLQLKDAQMHRPTLRQHGCGEIVRGVEALPADDGVIIEVYLDKLMRFDVEKRHTQQAWQVRLSFQKARLCDKLIMIDPGHGGENSGARGRTLLEKDVNLDVAMRIAQRLAAQDCTAILTRDSDVFVGLFDRAKFARQLAVDAFVSIHCNAMPRPDTNWGTETYYYTPQSNMLAVILQQQLLEALGRKDNGVRQARFVVIRENEIPSVLLELMYLNHQQEEQLLAKPEVRAAAAEAVVRGLRQYFEGRPDVPTSQTTVNEENGSNEAPQGHLAPTDGNPEGG